VASVNSSEFLTDDENRRYLVFSVTDIDLPALKLIDRTQLWAQIFYLLENVLKYWMDKEENNMISRINDSFWLKSEEEEMLIKFFVADNIHGVPMQQTDILNFLQVRNRFRLSARKLGIALRKRKFIRKSARLPDKDYSVYIYMVRELNDFDRTSIKRMKSRIFRWSRKSNIGKIAERLRFKGKRQSVWAAFLYTCFFYFIYYFITKIFVNYITQSIIPNTFIK